jgi:hypothetical protein
MDVTQDLERLFATIGNARDLDHADALITANDRVCGSCHACCVALDIDRSVDWPRDDKRSGTPCSDLVQIGKKRLGCGVYETRPSVCRHFHCFWKALSAWPDSLRPDRCGVLFHVETADEVASKAGFLASICVDETRPGALIAFQHEARAGRAPDRFDSSHALQQLAIQLGLYKHSKCLIMPVTGFAFSALDIPALRARYV